MIRFKNFKILLLLMLFAFAVNDAWAGGGSSYAGTWFTFRARYSATGEGKVYGDFTEKTNAVNKNNENVATRHRHDGGGTETGDTYTGNDITLHLFAEASDGWEFVEWRDNDGNKLSTSTPCDANGNATSESTKYGYAKVPSFKSKNVCARNLSSGEGANNSDHKAQHATYSENVNTRVDAYYVAVFRELISGPIVTAEPLDETLGLASFSPGDNQVGDVVTLATHPTGPKDKGYENKFLGWKHNGEYLRDDQNHIIRDNPYSFEVTEDNAGVYYAVYESGYVFHRIKNYVTQDYFVATGDNVAGTGITALPNALAQNFDMQNDARVDAGSIYEIDSYKNTDGSGRLVYNLKVQNKETKDYYSLPSIYIRLNQDADKNAWNFSTSVDDGQGTRLRVNEQGVQSVSSVLDDRSLWYIEPMDKGLETKENYFSLDPAKLVEVDGKYYTTLRTSWNILFNPEQMTPYIVKSVDETAGTFEMEPITGNIIPAGTPVIIETKSNDVEENRMVPTKTSFTGTKPETNLLKTSEKYFPNQPAPVSNCKGLYKNADGQLAFGGNVLNTVNGNEAYLQVAKEVVLPTKAQDITLAELLESDDTETLYNVTDLIGVLAVDHDKLLMCKDDNGFANKDERGSEEYIDFMHTVSAQDFECKAIPDPYDQSNWIALRVPDGGNLTTEMLNHKLTGVIGHLVNKVNPEFVLDKMPSAGGEAQVERNLFVAASFNGSNVQTSSVNNKEYYFVQPKPMEVANVEWAQWDGEKFIAPVAGEGHQNWNPAKLEGEFAFNGSYLEQGGVELESGHIYAMNPAVIKIDEGATQRALGLLEEASKSYVVYPLQLTKVSKVENGVITGVDVVPAGKAVSRVVYYNLMGVESTVPFHGVNIVVTEYSDGTRTSGKAVFR